MGSSFSLGKFVQDKKLPQQQCIEDEKRKELRNLIQEAVLQHLKLGF